MHYADWTQYVLFPVLVEICRLGSSAVVGVYVVDLGRLCFVDQ